MSRQQVYVVSVNSAVDSVYTNFEIAQTKAKELLNEFEPDNENSIVECDSFYSVVYHKNGDTVTRIDICSLAESAIPDKRISTEGFEYMSAGKENYPAYWSLDTNLCEFLAHNLELLAAGYSRPQGWDDYAWEAFLKYHARHLRAYAGNKFKNYDNDTELKNAQRALRNITHVLPDLWD